MDQPPVAGNGKPERHIMARRNYEALSIFMIVSFGSIAFGQSVAAAGQKDVSLQDLQRRLANKPLTASPNVPKFPFTAVAARAYQKAYADWLGLPLEWTNDL